MQEHTIARETSLLSNPWSTQAFMPHFSPVTVVVETHFVITCFLPLRGNWLSLSQKLMLLERDLEQSPFLRSCLFPEERFNCAVGIKKCIVVATMKVLTAWFQGNSKRDKKMRCQFSWNGAMNDWPVNLSVQK